jgi:hypothetical protein
VQRRTEGTADHQLDGHAAQPAPEPFLDGRGSLFVGDWNNNCVRVIALATGAVFPSEAHPRAWVVYFDEKGNVRSFRAADWAR